MNYKKIIKSRKIRLGILNLLNWIPDKIMIKIQYKIKTGKTLDLKNPTRYTEKLQWYKLYYKDLKMAICADKYTVRKYIEDLGYSSILNKLIGVYDDVSEMNFDKLPNKFVAKSTNGGGGNDVVICTDKNKLDKEFFLKKLKNWTKKKNNGAGREWVYYKIQPRIIIEELLEDDSGELVDYKFFCFKGKVEYVYVINGRILGDELKLGIFDKEYNQLGYFRGDEKRMITPPNKPEKFNEMINVAEKLSKEFPHARVDLYYVNSEIKFGELTFFDGSGYQTYKPDEFDYILGDKFDLPQKM